MLALGHVAEAEVAILRHAEAGRQVCNDATVAPSAEQLHAFGGWRCGCGARIQAVVQNHLKRHTQRV